MLGKVDPEAFHFCQPISQPRDRLTWIDREKQPTAHLVQLFIQVLPSDRWLHHDVHILLVELDNLVHVGEIDADASERGGEVSSFGQTVSNTRHNHRFLLNYYGNVMYGHDSIINHQEENYD